MSSQESNQARKCISSLASSSTIECEVTSTSLQCCYHLDEEDSLKYLYGCRLASSDIGEQKPFAQFQGQILTHLYTHITQTPCSNSSCHFHLRNSKRHSYSKPLHFFGRFLFVFALLLSLCTVSFAHKTVPWDFSSIEDVATSDDALHRSYTLKIPDLVAVSGHLFQYQLENDDFGTGSVHFLVCL